MPVCRFGLARAREPQRALARTWSFGPAKLAAVSLRSRTTRQGRPAKHAAAACGMIRGFT